MLCGWIFRPAQRPVAAPWYCMVKRTRPSWDAVASIAWSLAVLALAASLRASRASLTASGVSSAPRRAATSALATPAVTTPWARTHAVRAACWFPEDTAPPVTALIALFNRAFSSSTTRRAAWIASRSTGMPLALIR